MSVTVVKIWTIEADQLPVHYPTSTRTSTKYKYKYSLLSNESSTNRTSGVWVSEQRQCTILYDSQQSALSPSRRQRNAHSAGANEFPDWIYCESATWTTGRPISWDLVRCMLFMLQMFVCLCLCLLLCLCVPGGLICKTS